MQRRPTGGRRESTRPDPYEAQRTQDWTIMTAFATKGTTEYPVTDHEAEPVGFEEIITA